MKKIWKTVKGYEGLYELRNDGLLYSHPRQRTKGGYSYGNIVGERQKYLQFKLYKNGEPEPIYAHRLVYKTFVGDIPQGYDIHHKNGNSKDNRVENLELINCKAHYEKHRETRENKCSKQVGQYTSEGNLINIFKSIREAAKITGIERSDISKCCNNKTHYNSAGGYVWQFVAD